MKIENIEHFEEVTVILEQGVDYNAKDLVPNPLANNRLYHVNTDKLTRIAKSHGYDKWSWIGHANIESPGTQEAKFRKSLY